MKLLIGSVAAAILATTAVVAPTFAGAESPGHTSAPAPVAHVTARHGDGDHDRDDGHHKRRHHRHHPKPTPTPTTSTTTTPPPAPTLPAPTTSTTTSAPPTQTPSPTSLPTQTGAPIPFGVPGAWRLAFDEEFNGTALNTTRWATNWYGEGGTMNNVGTYARNVSVSGGLLHLTLASSSSGALIHTDIPGGYRLPVGGVVEARVMFPGNGSRIYNWPAWWLACTDGTYPQCGENDIAEGMSDGTLSVNYHSPAGDFNQPTPAGYWGGVFHTYTLHRLAHSCVVYWDGKQVASYATSDNGAAEILILNVGAKGLAAYGSAGTVLVDYVRAWQ